ncbi:unnamed protein product [Gongylonema pulchrum]|uniref:Zinc finger, CCHC-type n=1 Tax=Gongylonema pulchrum TaxID=637853 RepID=A0A183F173_9BILA|nr:unnamed protein product [Gongylonema pulchrum]
MPLTFERVKPELTAVEKQKSGMWKGGFYRTLLNDIARDGDAIKTEKKEIKQEIKDPDDTESIKTTTSRDHAKKLSALRKSSEKDDMLPALPSCSSPKKKSIYSDASDDEPEISNEGPVQLKPGLNILVSFSPKFAKFCCYLDDCGLPF